MTRDEAIQIVREESDQNYPDSLVDAFVKLGVLKLDKISSPLKRAESVIKRAISAEGSELQAFDILSYLDDAGLKIVEKDHA